MVFPEARIMNAATKTLAGWLAFALLGQTGSPLSAQSALGQLEGMTGQKVQSGAHGHQPGGEARAADARPAGGEPAGWGVRRTAGPDPVRESPDFTWSGPA